jgi:hypothetical protein
MHQFPRSAPLLREGYSICLCQVVSGHVSLTEISAILQRVLDRNAK